MRLTLYVRRGVRVEVPKEEALRVAVEVTMRAGESVGERLRVVVLVVLAVCPGDRVRVELDVHVGVDEEVSVLVKERGSE